MSISGKVLYDKIRELRPDLSNSVKPDILNKLCEEPSVQPFLKWFCKNVTQANVLTSEELQMKNKLQKSGEWLSGAALDNALEAAIKNQPELKDLINFDTHDLDDLSLDIESLKTAHIEDEEYINLLKDNIKNLVEVDNTLDEKLEDAETQLDKGNVEAQLMYDECLRVLADYDKSNFEFSNDIDNLLQVYAAAAENKGTQVLWTQMPIDFFLKQIELYNDYLEIFVKRQFGKCDKERQESDSDYETFMNDSKEKRVDEKIQELLSLKPILINSKVEEVSARIQEESYNAMLKYVQDIYNNGHLKIPQNNRMQEEIFELTRKRDFLEENIKLLRDRQLYEAIQQFVEIETTKILETVATARLERRKIRLDKLKKILHLARDSGHTHSDLLSMLMEMQYHCLKEVLEFVADARHYLSTEYSLSSLRCESMQQQQNEYSRLLASSPRNQNPFNQLFISMMCGDEVLDDPLGTALQKYNELVVEIKERKRDILETRLMEKIEKLSAMESDVTACYIKENHDGPTVSFKAVPYVISTQHDEIVNEIQEVRADVSEIRNKLKEQMRSDFGLEREKTILWQWFLADPDTLRAKYKDLKEKADGAHFGTVIKS